MLYGRMTFRSSTHLLLPSRRAALCLMAGAAAAPTALWATPDGTDEPVIAAASDLQFALGDIAAAFEETTGRSVKLAFGSSGSFARQIRQGAPFQMYLSADERYVRDLAQAGLTRGEGALYAVGRIAIIVPHGSPLKADGTLDDLAAALDDDRITRFAIANPEHAPYGQRAEQVLRHKGLWERIRPKLVFGENVSQAAQFATSANAQGGIVAYSIALAPRVSAMGEFALIPDDRHSPLRQRMVLLKTAGPVAERFYSYVQEPEARAVFRNYGFLLPGEAP